jgi:hypothetical protein
MDVGRGDDVRGLSADTASDYEADVQLAFMHTRRRPLVEFHLGEVVPIDARHVLDHLMAEALEASVPNLCLFGAVEGCFAQPFSPDG